LSKSKVDEIFGDLTEDQSSSDKRTVFHDDENKMPKLDVLFELPISEELRNNDLKSIIINPQYQIVSNIRHYGTFKTPINYEEIEGRFSIDWEITNDNIVNDLRKALGTEKINSITKSIISVLKLERDKIEYYINAIPYNGPLDSIIEFLKNPDESDTSDTSDVDGLKILNVSEAMKLDSGHIKVKGSIVSISQPFKMVQSCKIECVCGLLQKEEHFEVPLYREPLYKKEKCKSCQTVVVVNFDHINAISLELQDDEQFSDIERLDCILLDTDTKNIKIGERVNIRGSIHILNKNQKGNLVPILFSRNVIDYPNRKDISMTKLDEEAIKRFAKMNGENVISKLAEMFDKTVIGALVAKTALLFSLASAGDDSQHTRNNKANRNRIHTLIAGPPGLAKSSLIGTASKLIPNSRYESSQHSSGKSLTAIIEKENEQLSLRLGPIPLAKKSICALNEIGTIPFEEQKFLLDPMEEGRFTNNKHGINSTIDCPTTIVATTNVLRSSYDENSYDEPIQLNQIPCTPPVRDRFDLIVLISEETDDDAIAEYVEKKILNHTRDPPNYQTFLQKYIQFAREIEPSLSPACTNPLKVYYSQLRRSNPDIGSNRVLETLIRLCKVIAKLKLKHVIDEKDVSDAITFYNLLISKYVDSTNVPLEPDKYAYERCLEILKIKSDSEESLVKFEELIYEACLKDKVILSYICDSSKINSEKLKIENNRKARQVKDLLVNNPFIRIVHKKPMTLKYDQGMRNQYNSN
jgi:DNA replicative helicase MCM subunit Mcm2 (Cdc46/Mcm family)